MPKVDLSQIVETNRTSFVAIDNRGGEGDCHYPNIDLRWNVAADLHSRKDGGEI